MSGLFQVTENKFCSSYGYTVISSKTECAQARDKLQLGGTYAGTKNVKSGSWSYLPQGCSMWGSRIHFNTYGHLRSCDYSSASYCVCETGEASCDKCTQGKKFTSASTVCDDCGKGKYQGSNTATSASCTDCPLGKYADQTGQSYCKPCLQGSLSSKVGAEDCKLCTVGQYSDELNTDECKDCQTGKFNDQEGLQLCKDCTGGQYQAAKRGFGCDKCDIGRYGNEIG